ncbi:hypothetical protein COLO4_24961 [Corchorus olitorius]|uniref:DUF7769 domain-containing protein n=1 Tax=Corchorus olitorius TaxID=93759 RepID=A0A1R3I5M9_9ROSI|nr:hypothetical protein COLO4_24961 [Corchorus olitorius]
MEETDFDMEEAEVQGSSHKRRHNMLSNEERMAIYRICLENSNYGKLKDGTKKMLASSFGVCTKSIQRLWKRAKETGNVYHMKTKNCGRKRIQLDSDQFCEIPLSRRSTLRSMADALKISKSTLHRLLKIGAILRHSSPLRPNLTFENKIARLRFCLKMLESNDSTFKGMYDTIHIDEKWFYLIRKSVNYYLLPDEEEPHRTCKSKNFIPKVMFLAAVARPRFDTAGNVLFSGKIGVFPLVTKEPAKRSSVNRHAGTLETKPITTVNKDVMKTFLINKVIPTIREKWPRDNMRSPIYIQQDNARPHVKFDDADFKKATKENGFNVILTNQPANSPDLNVLDLGFFCAIQSLQQQAAAPKTIDDLIMAVENSFEEFSPVDSDKFFLSLQTCMREIMKVKGCNKYKILHIKKDQLSREGRLPTRITCDLAVVEEARDFLPLEENSD